MENKKSYRMIVNLEGDADMIEELRNRGLLEVFEMPADDETDCIFINLEKVLPEKDNEKNREEILKKIIDDILWMAIRYSNGRSTYAPSMIRDAVKRLKILYPDFKLKYDPTIEPPSEEDLKSAVSLKGDWLYDLFEEEENK